MIKLRFVGKEGLGDLFCYYLYDDVKVLWVEGQVLLNRSENIVSGGEIDNSLFWGTSVRSFVEFGGNNV